ncbi:peptide chain release factor 1 [Candidatus Micrarchaeota archaeon]|nr:peptide chain release factor 1 [Candidatus Micrarchaeota archaeon]
MADNSKALFDFKKKIETLKKFRGRGTELVTVYITPGYPIHETAAKLRDEYGQAANIKSKTTQKNVQGALERILNELKMYKKTPENGMALFCGNISEVEGRTDIQLFVLEPPMPLNTQFYRCESTFVTEPLEELADSTDTYGLVVMDGKEATVALLQGKKIKIIKQLNSTAHQKVSKGGQSAARYSRLHTEAVEYYYTRIGEAMNAFVGIKNFKGVIVGGPGPAKHDFVKQSPQNYQLKILGVVDTGYTDEYGIRETLEKSDEIIAGQEAVLEKKLMDRFMREVSTSGMAAYGLTDIQAKLQNKQIERLLVTEGLELKKFTVVCGACKKEKIVYGESYTPQDCSCGGKFEVKGGAGSKEGEQDVMADLLALAEQQGVPVEFISKDTAEGAQFYATFRGLGAFLRYK